MDYPRLKSYKLAMAQMMVEAGKPDANLDRAAARIAEAAKKGAKIVLLPTPADVSRATGKSSVGHCLRTHVTFQSTEYSSKISFLARHSVGERLGADTYRFLGVLVSALLETSRLPPCYRQVDGQCRTIVYKYSEVFRQTLHAGQPCTLRTQLEMWCRKTGCRFEFRTVVINLLVQQR